MTVVWTALAIETGAALVVAASLAGWARRHFTRDAGPAEAEAGPAA
ncbi:hypothetical protein ACH35V_07805 [Actinomadura sp. 1N219]